MATDRSQKALARSHQAQQFVMLAHKYDSKKHGLSGKKSVKGWYIFPKLDGIRARLHDGKLYSRTMRELAAPKAYIDLIIKKIGEKPWDGELMLANNTFQGTVSVARNFKESSMATWKDMEYHVFDIVNDDPFEKRHDILSKIKTDFNIKTVLSTGKVLTDDSVKDHMQDYLEQGYEGAILRNPSAGYEFGRSHNLLKVKEFQDIEVTIVNIEKGDGILSDMAGTLICHMDNGKEVRIGTGMNFDERKNPPKIGSRITITFFEYTDDGIPRFPVYKAVREDY